MDEKVLGGVMCEVDHLNVSLWKVKLHKSAPLNVLSFPF